MKKAGEQSLKLNNQELSTLKTGIAVTRKWLAASGIIAIVIFGGMAVLGILGFFILLIELTTHAGAYPPRPAELAVFVFAGILGLSFCAACIWLGAAALLTASKGREFLVSNSAADLLAYHARMKKVFVTIGGIAIFGIVMCILGAILVPAVFLGLSMGIVD